jgi:hypothetical protein|tara:strand:+ start:365 stop:514 length:150 start_codon:yes stop_codon:yes gene_type:complete
MQEIKVMITVTVEGNEADEAEAVLQTIERTDQLCDFVGIKAVKFELIEE